MTAKKIKRKITLTEQVEILSKELRRLAQAYDYDEYAHVGGGPEQALLDAQLPMYEKS